MDGGGAEATGSNTDTTAGASKGRDGTFLQLKPLGWVCVIMSRGVCHMIGAAQLELARKHRCIFLNRS